MNETKFDPNALVEYDIADVSAIKALLAGEADSEQQRRAISWVIKKAAGLYDFPFHSTDRETCFALGRGFVGMQIGLLAKVDIAKMKEKMRKTDAKT